MVEDPTGGVGAGIGKAIGEAALRKAAELAKRFREREYVFIEDQETIDAVRTQRNGREYALFKKYLGSTTQRVPVQTGLSLRRRAGDLDYVEDVRRKLYRKFGAKGVHLAMAAQAGILTLIMGELAKLGGDAKSYDADVQRLFDNIDAYAAFIERAADVKSEAEHWGRHLRVVGPPVFVVAARGSAHDEASKVAGLVLQRANEDYTAFSKVEGPQTTHVFVRR